MGIKHPGMGEALELLNQGLSVKEVRARTGIAESTLRIWRRSQPQAQPKVAPDDLKDMKIAALESRLKVAEGTNRLPVEGGSQFLDEAESLQATAETWKRYEFENAKKIERALAQSIFRLTLPGTGPVAFSFVSDQHISGGNTVDLRRMREDAEFIASTPNIYAILGGDGVDGHIKHRAAMLAARTQPDEQWRCFDYYLQIIAEKIAVMISGNHDHWLNQIGGVDMVRRLAEKNKIKFAPHHAYIEVTVGSVLYRICIAHQYRFNSSMNLTHCVKQMMNFGEHDFDIGAVCHHHEHATESFVRRGLSRWCCRPGAYQVYSDYSSQYGYPITKPTCPTVVLFPGERKIVGFDDVREAAVYMRGL
jgi:hypothetical protein